MRTFCFLFVWLSLALSIFGVLPVHALDNEKRVTFVSSLSPPYVYYSDDGELSGIVVEMVKMMDEASEFSINLYHVPTLRVYLELAEGNADLSILPPGTNVDTIAERVVEVSRASTVLASLNKNKDRLNTLADLSRMRVGYVKGINYGSLFENIPNIDEVPLLSTDIGVEMLSRGRVDFILSSERTLAYHLQDKRFSDSIAMAYRVGEVPAYLYVSKKSAYRKELKSQLSKVINQLIANRKWQETYEHLVLPE